MARWDIYNIVGDVTPLVEYEVQSRDFDWNDKINPTSDVGLAFYTVVNSLSESEKQWTDELYTLLAENGGGRIFKYEGSSVDGSVVCRELNVTEDCVVKEVNTWPGKIISFSRVDKDTIFDKAVHEWDDINEDLTLSSVPYSMEGVEPHLDPDPRFQLPLLSVVEEETGIQTVYQTHLRDGWRTSGELPECVYSRKEIEDIPDHMVELVEKGIIDAPSHIQKIIEEN